MSTAVVALTLTAAAIGLVLTLEHSLTQNRDDLSRARADDLAEQAAVGALPRVLTGLGDNPVGQVVDPSGHVVAASPGLAGRGPISPFVPEGGLPQQILLHDVPDSAETETYRVWARRAPTPQGDITIFVGASPESVTEAVSALRRTLAVGVPVVIALLAVGTTLLVGRALRPVENIRAEVESISGAALGRRVPVPGAADEVGRLAVTMNAMLDRLELSTRRQQDFVADASHELQSPLTAFRAQLEVALAHPDGVDWPALAHDLLDDSDEMERLVRDLLFLASRAETVQVRATSLVDLDDVVLEEVMGSRRPADMWIDASAVSAAPIQGRREEVSRLVRNLLDNALQHARSHVSVAVSHSTTCACLEIADDGDGIDSADRERVFERFTRPDGARTRGRGGTGLGLSIAKEIAQRHEATIRLIDNVDTTGAPGAGLRVVVRFPLAEPGQPT